MILLLANAKGGVGKTATATNLVTWLVHNKKVDVALIDLDTNKNSRNWGVYREQNKASLPDGLNQIHVEYLAETPNAYDRIVELNKNYQYVILDMGGHDSNVFRQCLLGTDEILIPLRPNQGDIDVTSDVLEVIEQANEIRSGELEIDPIMPFIYFTQVNSNPRVPALRQAVADFKAASGDAWMTIDSTASYSRQAYSTAYGAGLGVIELKIGASKAANDVNELAEIIFKEH